MAAPLLLTTYPANSDSGIPTGISLYLVFNRGIDLSQAKKNVVLYGTDFDITSGPDSAQWINTDLGTNPFYLKSPGFKGVVDCDYSVVYVNALYNEIDPQPNPVSEAAEVTGVYYHKLIITPKSPLAPDVLYKLQVIGDPSVINSGIGSKTVFAITPAIGNTGTGTLEVYGGYTGDNDVVWIEITTTGGIGDAEYKWWYGSLGVGSAVLGRTTSRRFRKLEDGLQVRFDGSVFNVGNKYSFNVEAITRLATSTTVQFTTGDGSYTVAPDSPSTPATPEPPTSTLPTDLDTVFDLVAVTPEDGASNLPITTSKVVLTFSTNLKPSTVTQSSVIVQRYPITGVYSDTQQPVELAKSLEVVGNVLTIRL